MDTTERKPISDLVDFPIEVFNEGRLEEARSRQRHYQSVELFVQVAGSAVFVVIITLYVANVSLPSWLLFVGGVYGLISIVFTIAPPLSRSVALEVESLDAERMLAQTGASHAEKRAERLFKSHEIGLRRYYDQTLRHGMLVFFIGVLCLSMGFCVVGYCLYQIFENEEFSIQEEIVVAVFGAISGLMVNFVSVIFLRMFSSISQSLQLFHERLVETNGLYFANYISEKVTDKEARDRLIGEMAINISGGKK